MSARTFDAASAAAGAATAARSALCRLLQRYPVAQRPTVLQLLALQGLISIQRACSTEPHRALDELHAAIGPSHLKGLFAGLGSISASAFPTSCSSAPSPSPPALSPCPYGREEHQGEHLGRNSPDGGKALVAPCGSATRAHPPDAASDSVLEALSEAESALPRRPGEVTAAEKVSARRKAVQRREQCRAALQEQQKLQAKASAQRSIYPDWWYELAGGQRPAQNPLIQREPPRLAYSTPKASPSPHQASHRRPKPSASRAAAAGSGVVNNSRPSTAGSVATSSRSLGYSPSLKPPSPSIVKRRNRDENEKSAGGFASRLRTKASYMLQVRAAEEAAAGKQQQPKPKSLNPAPEAVPHKQSYPKAWVAEIPIYDDPPPSRPPAVHPTKGDHEQQNQGYSRASAGGSRDEASQSSLETAPSSPHQAKATDIRSDLIPDMGLAQTFGEDKLWDNQSKDTRAIPEDIDRMLANPWMADILEASSVEKGARILGYPHAINSQIAA